MKIHILYNFHQGPYGGGNQFLKALKKEFEKQSVYEDNTGKSDCILFSSYPFRNEILFNIVYKIKKKFPHKVIIYRLDGPISLVRGKDRDIDRIISQFNDLFVDGIIFQSNWCRKQNKKHFGISSDYETVIHNAANNEIFNRTGRKVFNIEEKIRLITTSWSSNWRKGFEIYKYLDNELDSNRCSMILVGRSPIEFKNIKWIKPVTSKELAEILKKHDIFVTASQRDPCSNSLIEALSCGLPAVVLNDGGHPELLKEGGELFNGKADVIEKIEKVAKDYHYYQFKIPEFSIEKVAHDYYEFAEKIYNDVQNGIYEPKEISFRTKIGFYKMKFMILEWRVRNKTSLIKQKL